MGDPTHRSGLRARGRGRGGHRGDHLFLVQEDNLLIVRHIYLVGESGIWRHMVLIWREGMAAYASYVERA